MLSHICYSVLIIVLTTAFGCDLLHRKNLLFPLAIWMHRRLSKKYGIQIPRRCKIGYGFYIGHGVGIGY